MIPVIILLGAALMLLGAYLIHPGLAIGLVGLFLVWLGTESAKQVQQ